jgi:hypothetical protein
LTVLKDIARLFLASLGRVHMPWYDLVLTVHFLGVIALFGFFILQARAGTRLRAATDPADVEPWVTFLWAVRPMLSGGAGLLLGSGIVLAALGWRSAAAFTIVGLGTVLGVWVTGALVGGRHLRSIRQALGASTASDSLALMRVVRAPRPWVVMGALNGAAASVLIVMTLKPEWKWAVALLATGIGAGAAVTWLALERDSSGARKER